MAINGHRLTSTSAIRFAGQAIMVNYRPLTRPYVITALGAPDLSQRFTDGEGGAYLNELTSAYGAKTTVSAVEHARVPAATPLALRYAHPDPRTAATDPPQTNSGETSPGQTDPGQRTPQEAPS